MKRRDFLKILSQSAAGLALAPSVAQALCPPQNLAVLGGRAVTDNTPCAGTGSLGSKIKWNPGFYISLWGDGHRDSEVSRTNNLTFMRRFENDPRIKGFYIRKYIKMWERGTSSPAFDYAYESNGVRYGGFAMVDWYLQQCASFLHKKRMMFCVEQTAFGSNPLPQYWTDQGWQVDGPYSVRAKFEDAACMTRYLAIWGALAGRYNSHPLVEMISQEESTILTSDKSGYITQWKRMLSDGVRMWPNTLVRSNQNFTIDPSRERELLQHIELLNAAGVGCVIVGGPDHESGLSDPASPIKRCPANRLWRGETVDGVTWKDIRGKMPWIGETQDGGYTEGTVQDSATNVISYHKNTMRASHIGFYDYNKWSNETWPAIQAVNGEANSTPPTCLSGRTITGGV